jgi:hypothetical protein
MSLRNLPYLQAEVFDVNYPWACLPAVTGWLLFLSHSAFAVSKHAFLL